MSQSPAVPLPAPKERRRLREAKSLTQAEVAAHIGVSRETVRAWESGRTHPRGQRRVAYARFLEGLVEERGVGVSAAEVASAEVSSAEGGESARGRGRPEVQPEAQERPEAQARSSAPTLAQVQAEAEARAEERARARELAEARVEAEAEARAATAAADSPDEPPTAEAAFDALCARTAPALVRQTYALTGRRALAQESVERAFQLAWQRWPEVAVDRDPAGWVRAAAHEYALSPWHRFRPAHRGPDVPPAEESHRALLAALLNLPPTQRRTLLLYDGVGLGLPETAAETEASTPAAASRLLHAREAVAEHLRTADEPPEALHEHLGALGGTERLVVPRPARVRIGSERRARLWTRAAIAFTALIIGATALTVRTAPTRYEPPQSPGRAISGVPPRMGPEPLSYEDEVLREKLRKEPTRGPARLIPTAE
ncbi:sigma factor-like helix-turn-helix DNA-binding protein [Streptomyces sp. NPDC127108]|uniref:sigma factor-like helix-turn-helix DNA-binding protein n=1 Tax=Streptomyces sp. NPDC127108 TaxID=3345361 RepID=UPI0036257B8A